MWNGEKTRYDERGFHAIGSARVYAYAAHGMLQHYGAGNAIVLMRSSAHTAS